MSYQPERQGEWGIPFEENRYHTELLATRDGCQLFLQSWQAESEHVLLILHGLGGHGGWYIDLAQELATQGITVYTMDHRGFGRSGGLQGHIDRHQTYIEDIAFVLTRLCERHPTGKLSILGHSMGGIFAAYVAALHKELIQGVIFLNPWIQDSAQIPIPTTVSIFVGGLLRSRRSWKLGGDVETMTLNPEAQQMLRADPLWRQAQTATFLVQIFLLRTGVLKMARQITLPALVLQAEQDRAVRPLATRRFFQQLASTKKTWISYPTFAHDTQFEANRSQLDQDIFNWLQAISET
ncbi:alpha/beta fold hydrolase [Tengunoibacter tsumagoiensis]|uniref:Lysophospholipase n=1 Tax=Tengunoibacter tsumagoiensis TaxID=2014871 RepID=A0A402A1M5_9CHLR|nr:alpha/beta fold hydrolase [Tengunoibacter tsumagoiensis]GCE13043.1 lysophospholipase [Tengunoibacter tsumagoiensis]